MPQPIRAAAGRTTRSRTLAFFVEALVASQLTGAASTSRLGFPASPPTRPIGHANSHHKQGYPLARIGLAIDDPARSVAIAAAAAGEASRRTRTERDYLQQEQLRGVERQYALARDQNATANIYGYNGKQDISQHFLGLTAAYRF